MSTVRFSEANFSKSIPANAVCGGMDDDGNKLYVGRALHQGDYLPACINMEKKYCKVTYEGKTYEKSDFEFLIATNVRWVDESNGDVSAGAVYVDRDAIFFIGRVSSDGHYLPCRIVQNADPEDHGAHYHYYKSVIRNKTYQVLVIDGPFSDKATNITRKRLDGKHVRASAGGINLNFNNCTFVLPDNAEAIRELGKQFRQLTTTSRNAIKE